MGRGLPGMGWRWGKILGTRLTRPVVQPRLMLYYNNVRAYLNLTYSFAQGNEAI